MTVATTLARPLVVPGIDRWVYAGTAALLLITAIVGFAPRSVEILTGLRRNPPLVVHIHAAVIVAWLGLLVIQATLISTARAALHKKLGLASLLLGPAVVASMVAVTIWRFGERVSLGQTVAGANILFSQGRSIVYFSIFFLWAILVRKNDPETHKRLMILASLMPFGAAITRIGWLPTTMPESYTAVHAYMFLLLVPVLVHDVVRLGRPHSAYLIGLALLLPWVVATQTLWSSPWWVATASRLMGY